MPPGSEARFVSHDTAGTPGGTSTGNLVSFHTDGKSSYEIALADIRRAERFVWLETYILERDEVGVEFIHALADAARRGCDVRLLFDRFGSPTMGREQAKPIEDAGGRIAIYNPLVPRGRLGRKISTFLHRDHRKILIADGVGFTGGRNVGRDYGSDGPDRFFDITARIEGPAVEHLATVFADAFQDATGEAVPRIAVATSYDSGIQVDVLELNNEKAHHDLDDALQAAVRSARSSILLVTPYFVPPEWFLAELSAAAARGVDVQLLTAGRSDVPFIKVAGRHLYGHLLRRGIRVYEMQNPTLHAKYIVIDGCYGLVGSYNVDSYGAAFNLELGVGLHGEDPAHRLTEIFWTSLERSEEVFLEDWMSRGPLTRLRQWAAFRLASVDSKRRAKWEGRGLDAPQIGK